MLNCHPLRFNQIPSSRNLLQLNQVRYVHFFHGERAVHRILSMMPHVLCTWYPFGNQAQITKKKTGPGCPKGQPTLTQENEPRTPGFFPFGVREGLEFTSTPPDGTLLGSGRGSCTQSLTLAARVCLSVPPLHCHFQIKQTRLKNSIVTPDSRQTVCNGLAFSTRDVFDNAKQHCQ